MSAPAPTPTPAPAPPPEPAPAASSPAVAPSPWRHRLAALACYAVAGALLAYDFFALRPAYHEQKARAVGLAASGQTSAEARTALAKDIHELIERADWRPRALYAAFGVATGGTSILWVGGALDRRRRRKEAQAALRRL